MSLQVRKDREKNGRCVSRPTLLQQKASKSIDPRNVCSSEASFAPDFEALKLTEWVGRVSCNFRNVQTIRVTAGN